MEHVIIFDMQGNYSVFNLFYSRNEIISIGMNLRNLPG